MAIGGGKSAPRARPPAQSACSQSCIQSLHPPPPKAQPGPSTQPDACLQRKWPPKELPGDSAHGLCLCRDRRCLRKQPRTLTASKVRGGHGAATSTRNPRQHWPLFPLSTPQLALGGSSLCCQTHLLGHAGAGGWGFPVLISGSSCSLHTALRRLWAALR